MRKSVVSLVSFIALLASACSYETKNYYGSSGSSGASSDFGGQAGSAGTSSQAGSGGFGGSSGEAGSAGAAGVEVDAGGAAGFAGVGGTSSDGGAAGQAGEAGSAGSSGYNPISFHAELGYENPASDFIVPTPCSNCLIFGAKIGLVEALFVNDPDSVPVRVTSAKVCQTDPGGDAADFLGAGIFWASNEFVSADASSPDGCWYMTPTSYDIVLDPGGSHLNWISAQIAEPQPWSVAGGVLHGVARSGHTPILELKELTVTSTDGKYQKTLPLSLAGNPMTLRAGMPYFSQVDVPLPLLIEGAENVIHRVRVGVYHKVGLRHLEIYLEKHGDFTVTGFKLERCNWDFSTCQVVPSDQVAISIYDDMVHGALTHVLPQDDGATVNVEFLKEEALDADAYYQVKAVPWGTSSGDTLETYYWQSLNQGVVTGQLGPMSYGNYTLRINGSDTIGTVIWTDLSEGADHDPSILGSTDYTNDFQIDFGYFSIDPVTTLTVP